MIIDGVGEKMTSAKVSHTINAVEHIYTHTHTQKHKPEEKLSSLRLTVTITDDLQSVQSNMYEYNRQINTFKSVLLAINLEDALDQQVDIYWMIVSVYGPKALFQLVR